MISWCKKLPALSVLILLACGEPPADTPPSDTPAADDAQSAVPLSPAQLNGQQVYETMCWTCHGMGGRGDGPAVAAGAVTAPPNFQAAGYAELSTAELERRFAGVWDGNDPTHPHMQYVASLLERESFTNALAYLPALLYPPELQGSTIAGRATFMTRCAPCHGELGTGVGEVSDVLLVAAADLTQDSLAAVRNFDGVHRLIKEGGSPAVHGSSMPAWGLVFDDGTIWDLVAYIASLQPGVLSEPPAPGP